MRFLILLFLNGTARPAINEAVIEPAVEVALAEGRERVDTAWEEGAEMTTKLMFTITSILTLILGVSWLAVTETMLAGWNMPADAATVYMSKRFAGLFFGYGTMMWLGRRAEASLARSAMVAGGLAVSAVMAVVTVMGVVSGVTGPAAWGAVAVEVLLAGGFGYLLFTGRS
ncbi:MAG: hypothetical protein HZB13_00880 [Acidobacteria bacterium]|nr:hypothetical protein [Acidobacteriota bacterium]